MALSKKDLKRIEDEERARHEIKKQILLEEQGRSNERTASEIDSGKKGIGGCLGCLIILVSTIIIIIIASSQLPNSSANTASRRQSTPNRSNLNDNELADFAKKIIKKRFGDDASVFVGGPRYTLLRRLSDKRVIVHLEVRSTQPGNSPKGRLFERFYSVELYQNDSDQWQYVSDTFTPWNR